jgi:hypothetical protein
MRLNVFAEGNGGDQEIEIVGDKAGLTFLVQRLSRLLDRRAPDHEHFMSAEWGGAELTSEAAPSNLEKIHSLRLQLVP